MFSEDTEGLWWEEFVYFVVVVRNLYRRRNVCNRKMLDPDECGHCLL